MMIDRRKLFYLALLVLPTCSSSNVNVAEVSTSNAVRENGRSEPRIRISASYNSALFREYVSVNIRNLELFAVCFPKSDLLPGSETTNVRDSNGHPLSGSSDEVLEEFRGINVAGPLVVLRPGKTHSELVALEENHLSRPTIILQIGFGAFRCRDLFDGGSANLRPVFFQNVFRVENGRIYEQPELRFQIGEEPPPRRYRL